MNFSRQTRRRDIAPVILELEASEAIAIAVALELAGRVGDWSDFPRIPAMLREQRDRIYLQLDMIPTYTTGRKAPHPI